MKIRPVLAASALAAVLFAPDFPFASAEQTRVPYSDTEAGNHAGDEAVVTGKVAAITKSAKGTTYLNFGAKFPRQTFTGVVFAGDAETVGDLSPFEGKTVALTGRIELSPDGKPQIVIKSAEQLKIAESGPVAATPAPQKIAAPPAPPIPASPSIAAALPAPKPTPPPKDPETRRVVLAANWSSAPQTGEMARKDLALLFGSRIASGEKSVAEDRIVIYPEVPYLTPLTTARRSLHLENTNAGRTKITTPGLPVASLTANAFPGIFPGGFTTLTLVTDISDHVVSVHLTDTNPRQRTADITDVGGYHIYNFIAQREKSAGQLVIKHEIIREGAPAGVVVVDSLLIDPGAADPSAPARTSSKSKSSFAARTPRTGKILERSRWYVPEPLVTVILRASGNR